MAGGFGTRLLADPPLPFATWSAKGKGRSAERHYNTMAWDELLALDVASLAAPACVLFIWICWPHLFRYRELIEVIRWKNCARGSGMKPALGK